MALKNNRIFMQAGGAPAYSCGFPASSLYFTGHSVRMDVELPQNPQN
jgi:hypothetical protein